MADTINHNIRVAQLVTGESIICNFTQVKEEEKFVGYQVLYPLALTLSANPTETGGEETYSVTYRRWSPSHHMKIIVLIHLLLSRQCPHPKIF